MDESSTSGDRELLRRAAAGDGRAADAVFRAHAGVARTVARRVLRDSHLAEDAVQEAFLDLWRNASRFDPRRAGLRAWICVLAHRRAVDIARREARRRSADEQLGDVDPASYTAEELVLLRYERNRVQIAVAELNEPQRRVVELAFYGGLTQAQVAEHLGVPLGTIKSRMFTALGRLGSLLAAPA